jgi:hypothetical protein
VDEQPSDDVPTPAVPLDYFEQHREPWVPVVRMVTRLVIWLQVYILLYYLAEVSGYFAHLLTPGFRAPAATGLPLVVAFPEFLGHLAILLGAMDARKMREEGRRWITGGSMFLMLLALPSYMAVGLYQAGSYRYSHYYGPVYTIVFLCKRILAAAGSMIVPFFIWKFFKRPEVRALFGFRAD